MDRISQLHDELPLRILSLLPTTKDVVATMVLSKRWQFLWMFVPKLVYDDSYQNIEYGKFSRFVDRSLFVHKAPLIGTLDFKLGKTCGAEDIAVWIRAAEKCSVGELIIKIDASSSIRRDPATLPRSLYTGCRMLVALSLKAILVDDVTSPISFPSLKRLSLFSVKYPGDEFLEELVVDQCRDDNVTIFDVRSPSLKSLSMYTSEDRDTDDAYGFVIDAPSLELLEIHDHTGGFCVIDNEMPMIVWADVDISHSHSGKILGSITSVIYVYQPQR